MKKATSRRTVLRCPSVARSRDGSRARRQASARDAAAPPASATRSPPRCCAKAPTSSSTAARKKPSTRRSRVSREATGRTRRRASPRDMSTAEGTDAIHAAFPNVDILVNNVGGYGPQAFEQSTDEDWYRLIDLNVMSGVRLSRLYLPRMRERNWGRIIFISSESAYHIPPDSIHYGMTKAAQIAVSRGLAEATATTGITVNSVVPGPDADAVRRQLPRAASRAGPRSGRSPSGSSSITFRPDVADQALRRSRRGRQLRGVRREPARVGDDGRGAARRRRHGQERVLTSGEV